MLTKEETDKLYAIWTDNLLIWVEDFLGHYLTSDIPDFHKTIYDLIQHKNRLALAAPRGFGKSIICSVFYPLWCALFQKKKDVLIISASENLSIEWLRKMRVEMETNPLLFRYFGDLRSNKWTENHLILNNKPKTNIRARGAGGQIRGFRPDLIVLDDIETDESVASSEQRTKLRDWVFKACLNTLLPHGQFIWIGTIISPLALLQEMLDSDNDWEKRKYRAYEDGRQEKGQELWQSLWPHKKLQQRKREIGSTAFASEYLNDPILNESAPIKPHQIRYWNELPTSLSTVIAVDPAYSDDERADYKVAALVGINHLHNRYLITYIRTHSPGGEFIDSILNLWLQNKATCTAVGIPNSGTEKEFFNSFMRKAQERHLYPPVVELKNIFKRGTDKVIRKKKDRIVAALQPLFESGKYYIHANHEEAKDELLTIGASRWDDICFIKGTKIATMFGDKNIEEIKANDYVITQYGMNKVLDSKCTGIKEVISKNGLTGSPQHKIFSYNKGLVSMDTLCYTDKVSNLTLKEALVWRYKKVLCSMELPTVLWAERKNIILVSQKIIKDGKILKDFMLRFGNFIINKKFLKAIMFTIKTVTLLITTYLTFNVYRVANIINFLKGVMKLKCENIWIKLGRLLHYGINLKKVGNGIGNMLLKIINVSHIKPCYALNAGMCSNQNIQIQSIVQEDANRKREEREEPITKAENVLFAVQNSQSINMQKHEHVQKSANINISELKKLQKVYNLQIDCVGMYYANGILVSNCDCLCYCETIITPTYIEPDVLERGRYGELLDEEKPKIQSDYGY